MRDSGWPMKPMRAVLRLYKAPRAVHAPEDQVSTLGIRWYGLGLFAKPGRRSDIKGESYYQLKPGTLVYSKLFAWKQSFGPANPECPRQLGNGFACGGESAQLLLPFEAQLGGLGGRELAGAARVTGGRAPLATELELEFSERRHDRRYSTTSGRTGIHVFPQGAQQNSALTEICDGPCHLCHRSTQPIDGGDNHGVAFTGVVQQSRQTWPVNIDRTREFVGEDTVLADSSCGEHAELSLQILAGGADSGITEDRRHAMTVSFTPDRADLRHAE